METYSIAGSLFSDEDDLIPVNLFENMPFDTEHETIAHWRAGDIISVLEDEGKLKGDQLVKLNHVMVIKTYVMEDSIEDTIKRIEEGGQAAPRFREAMEYTVSYSIYEKSLVAGMSERIEGLDQKIRDKKISRII
jgi:hypothetical protein